MAHPNINMRDPVMYRILHEPPHHRTGSTWKIYPMYDWAHGQNDSMEGITIPCARWNTKTTAALRVVPQQLDVWKPRQIEFARLNMTYTVMSKRKLRRLVEGGLVTGWTIRACPPCAPCAAAAIPRCHPRFHPPRGCRKELQRQRCVPAGGLRTRRSQQARFAPHGRAQAGESHH